MISLAGHTKFSRAEVGGVMGGGKNIRMATRLPDDSPLASYPDSGEVIPPLVCGMCG